MALFILSLIALLILGGCGSQAESANQNAGDNSAANSTRQPTPAAGTAEIAPIDPLEENQTQPPVRIEIPDIGLDVPVVEMGWQIVMANGQRTTRWVVPEIEVGWHANSAGVGGEGNTILSGRQIGTDAPLASLAMGEIQPGQAVYLTDSDGIVFVYRIVEVTDPIPAIGASEADMAETAAYFDPNPDETPRLTLATGWPEFTTTHRIFAVGELEGVAR